MMCSRRKCTHAKTRQIGLSLVELMVGLVIGLVVMGGAAVVLIGNRQTSQFKENNDRYYESLRFVAGTFHRVIRQSSSFVSVKEDGVMIVSMPAVAGSHDCIGREFTTGQVNGVLVSRIENQFYRNTSNQLICRDSSNAENILADDVRNISFLFGVDSNADLIISESEYISAISVVDWNKAVSVKIGLVQSNGSAIDFVVALHQKIMSNGGSSI